VRVIDNGMGISPELLPRIFELFTQGDRTLDRSQGGLGIGLMLVFSLVALHGGTVEAQSEGVGRGSEFVVRLPLLKNTLPSPEDAAPVEMPAAAAAPALPRPRLLVVDDNHDSADTLADLGVDWGYAVRCAYDGLSAIELAREYRPQIILLDIGLPGLDGYEVARRLRAEPALNGVRLVAFTGYGSADDRERSQEAGFDHHLTKPVDPHELESLFFALLCPPGGSPPQPPEERR
jgi:CheY-like chemotaxis protein